MKNSADLGGCYPPRPSTSVDNTLLDLQVSSYPTKAEFNNCLFSPMTCSAGYANASTLHLYPEMQANEIQCSL